MRLNIKASTATTVLQKPISTSIFVWNINENTAEITDIPVYGRWLEYHYPGQGLGLKANQSSPHCYGIHD